MKSTGIVRKVDELGRVILPMELRRNLRIVEKDPLEIFIEDDKIILQKYQSPMTCLITGEVSHKNHRLLEGQLVLSEKGMNILYEKLEESINDYKKKQKND
jgi:AbrB family transcriptional regulator, transcriptional pleiotropic regulator of transition state genes